MNTEAQENKDQQEADRIANHLASMPVYGSASTPKPVLRALMLSTGGEMIVGGRLYRIRSEHLGAGVYRVSLEPPKEDAP